MAASDVLGGVFQITADALTTGIGGMAIVAFWKRWIVPGESLKDKQKECDEWKALYEKEREAHQATRDAYAAASQRSDAGVEAARGYAALIRALRDIDPPQAIGPGGG